MVELHGPALGAVKKDWARWISCGSICNGSRRPNLLEQICSMRRRWRSGISLVPVPTYSFRYTLALVLTSAGAAAYLIITSWRLFLAWTGGIHDPHWEGVPIHEAAFVGAQCVAFIQMAVAVNRERQRGAFFHSPPMRCADISSHFPLINLINHLPVHPDNLFTFSPVHLFSHSPS
jgi:hypothetical protein